MCLMNVDPSVLSRGFSIMQSMRDVVTRCLQKDPRLRPTAAQLLEHKFFKVGTHERDSS